MADFALTPAQLSAACVAWQFGCPVFGLWAARNIKHMTVRQYGDLIALVRRELHDTTDYSKESEHGNQD